MIPGRSGPSDGAAQNRLLLRPLRLILGPFVTSEGVPCAEDPSAYPFQVWWASPLGGQGRTPWFHLCFSMN